MLNIFWTFLEVPSIIWLFGQLRSVEHILRDFAMDFYIQDYLIRGHGNLIYDHFLIKS